MHRIGAVRAVLGAVAVAVLPWACFFGGFARWIPRLGFGAIPVAVLAAIAWVVLTPVEPLGRWVQQRLSGRSAALSPRLGHVSEGLSIALGLPRTWVGLVESALPNVLVLPVRKNEVTVVATSAAVDGLSRAQLEALVASQVAVGQDRWVRIATKAQLATAPFVFVAIAGSVLSGFHPLVVVCSFASAFILGFSTLGRRPDAARDLVADGVAVRTTKDPDALAAALRAIGAAAAAASTAKVGVPGFLSDAFAVLSTRSRVTTTTKVNGRTTRQWSTADEIRTEMDLRATRIERAAAGDFDGLDSLAGYRAAFKNMGRVARSLDNAPPDELDADRSPPG
jgi:Zn-dependent protease with chaperone function